MSIHNEDIRLGMSQSHRLFCEGDFEGAVNGYLRLLETGYAPASCALAVVHEAGCNGRGRDIVEAEKWYKRAAEETGDFHAYMGLVRLSLYPKSPVFNPQSALPHLLLMEQYIEKKGQKEPGVHYALGLLYLNGSGVELDRERARSYLAVASTHGHLLARATLAKLDVENGSVIDWVKFLRTAIAVKRQKRRDPSHPSVSINPWSC